MDAVRGFFGIIALYALAACSGPAPGESSPGAPRTCERTCNSQYDSCMDRFAGAQPEGSPGALHDTGNMTLAPNNVCPDQLKSCLRSCLN
jgi:hypothetical protein